MDNVINYFKNNTIANITSFETDDIYLAQYFNWSSTLYYSSIDSNNNAIILPVPNSDIVTIWEDIYKQAELSNSCEYPLDNLISAAVYIERIKDIQYIYSYITKIFNASTLNIASNTTIQTSYDNKLLEIDNNLSEYNNLVLYWTNLLEATLLDNNFTDISDIKKRSHNLIMSAIEYIHILTDCKIKYSRVLIQKVYNFYIPSTVLSASVYTESLIPLLNEFFNSRIEALTQYSHNLSVLIKLYNKAFNATIEFIPETNIDNNASIEHEVKSCIGKYFKLEFTLPYIQYINGMESSILTVPRSDIVAMWVDIYKQAELSNTTPTQNLINASRYIKTIKDINAIAESLILYVDAQGNIVPMLDDEGVVVDNLLPIVQVDGSTIEITDQHGNVIPIGTKYTKEERSSHITLTDYNTSLYIKKILYSIDILSNSASITPVIIEQISKLIKSAKIYIATQDKHISISLYSMPILQQLYRFYIPSTVYKASEYAESLVPELIEFYQDEKRSSNLASFRNNLELLEQLFSVVSITTSNK